VVKKSDQCITQIRFEIEQAKDSQFKLVELEKKLSKDPKHLKSIQTLAAELKKLKQETNHLGVKTLILSKKPRFISTLDVENSYFKQPVLDETYVNKILYTESTQKYVLFFMYLDFANITSSQFSRIHTHNRGFFLDEDMYPANPYLNIQKVYKK
jgi:hypothetical protein